MNVGKTLFAQVMEFVPWKTFGRIVERHQGVGADLNLTHRWVNFRSAPTAHWRKSAFIAFNATVSRGSQVQFRPQPPVDGQS